MKYSTFPGFFAVFIVSPCDLSCITDNAVSTPTTSRVFNLKLSLPRTTTHSHNMLSYLSLLFTITAITQIDGFKLHKRVRRIVGGKNTDISEFPYQLSLRASNSHICGAVLISESWALTGAHCTSAYINSKKLSLLAGTTDYLRGGQVREVESIINHPNYNGYRFDYDVSVIKAATPFILDVTVKPIALPEKGAIFAEGTSAVTSGWGKLSKTNNQLPVVLQKTMLLIVSENECNSVYNGMVTDNMICAGSDTGICDGDSGGPLVVDNTLVGIASWSKGCALLHYPSVFTRVAAFREWISTNTDIDSYEATSPAITNLID